MLTPVEVWAHRVDAHHVVFEHDGVRWLFALDLPLGVAVREDYKLRLRGCDVSQGADGITRMSIHVAHVRRGSEGDNHADIDVWLRIGGTGPAGEAEMLDAQRALLCSTARPQPPEPCTGLAHDPAYCPAEHSTRFDLPGKRFVVVALWPQPFSADRPREREWLPLWVRATTEYEDAADHSVGHIAAHYDFGRKRVFGSIVEFLDAHGLRREIRYDDPDAFDGILETHAAALGALAEIAGVGWHPTHEIRYYDREGFEDERIWVVDAQACGESLAAAPTLGEFLAGAASTWRLGPETGWLRDGESITRRDHERYGEAHYVIEARMPGVPTG